MAAVDGPMLALLVPPLAFALVMGLWAVASRLVFLRSLAHIPGPPHSFLLGALATMRRFPSFADRQHDFFEGLHAAYGAVVRLVLPFGSGALIVCSERDTISLVLADHQAFPQRARCHDLPMSLAAQPLDAKWQACRAALALALSPAAQRERHAALAEHAQQLCAALLAGGAEDGSGAGQRPRPLEVEVGAPIGAAVLRALAQLTLGTTRAQTAGLARASEDLASGLARSAWLPPLLLDLLDALPQPLRPPFRMRATAAKARLLALAAEAYDEALAREGACSLVAELARAGVPRAAACEISAGLLAHAPQATARALCWAVHLLSRNPAEQGAARAELRDACGADGAPSCEQLRGLRRLRAVWLEALRLFPPVPALSRVAAPRGAGAAQLGGEPLPRGATVFYSFASAARAEAAFGPDAGEFRPSRHLEGDGAGLEGDGPLWLPFGAGARRCAGARLAEDVGACCLAAILQAFELSPPAAAADDVPTATTADGTLSPAQGLCVWLTPRL